MRKKSGSAAGIIVFALCLLLTTVMFLKEISDCNRYSRVYSSPVKTTGRITDHDEYTDSDSDTTYYAYVSYEIDGVVYKNIQYQSTGSSSSRVALGEYVDVLVNPEDHSELLADVASPFSVVFYGVSEAFLFAIMFDFFMDKKLSYDIPSVYEKETLENDLKFALIKRKFRPFLFFATVVLFLLGGIYPMIFEDGLIYVVAIITGIWWAVLVCKLCRDLSVVKDGDYSVFKDVLVDKTKKTDSDGDTDYYFVYSGRNGNWRKRVSYTEYSQTFVGATVYSVYLGKRKKPVLHCNQQGKTTVNN